MLTCIPISGAKIVSVVPGDHQSLVQKVRVCARTWRKYVLFLMMRVSTRDAVCVADTKQAS